MKIYAERAAHTAQKVKFSIMDFFSKCEQFLRKLWIWSNLLKKSLMENFTFCAVPYVFYEKAVLEKFREKLHK